MTTAELIVKLSEIIYAHDSNNAYTCANCRRMSAALLKILNKARNEVFEERHSTDIVGIAEQDQRIEKAKREIEEFDFDITDEEEIEPIIEPTKAETKSLKRSLSSFAAKYPNLIKS